MQVSGHPCFGNTQQSLQIHPARPRLLSCEDNTLPPFFSVARQFLNCFFLWGAVFLPLCPPPARHQATGAEKGPARHMGGADIMPELSG